MTFHLITLFPESFDSYVQSSIVGRAIREKKIKLQFYNPRDFIARPRAKSRGKWFYRQTDSKPYGGGPGMVLEALPILKAVKAALSTCRRSLTVNKGNSRLSASVKAAKIIIFSPNGKQFANPIARVWHKKYEHLILICGHYEGIDARVKKILKAEEISIGPFVLTGGELPALIVLDAMARQIPNVLGKPESLEENRIASHEVYTRPEVLDYQGIKYRVPKVLISGHHKKIEEWRQKRQ
jgi:tRNA (guanine37-N1)-methyltransferase